MDTEPTYKNSNIVYEERRKTKGVYAHKNRPEKLHFLYRERIKKKNQGVYGYKNKTQKTSLSVLKKEEKPKGFMNTKRQTLRDCTLCNEERRKNQKGSWEKQALEDCTLCTEERRKTRRVYGSYEHHFVLLLADQVLLQHEY